MFEQVRRFAALLGVVVMVVSVLVGVPASPVGAADAEAEIYVSSSSAGNVDGVAFTSGDILVYDTAADTWALFFDGSDVLPASANIDSLQIVDDDPANAEIIMGFTGLVTVGGIGSVDDSDLVTFTGVAGSATSGTFEHVLDGSDVGLTSGGEDVDALAVASESLVVSTLGTGSVPGPGGSTLSVPDEDLARFTGVPGVPSAGDFVPFLDSSDVGFTGDLVSAWIDPGTNEIFGSALNGFSIGGLSGDGDDIFVFTGTTGDPSSGTFGLFWDGDAHRFGGEQIDALSITIGSPPPPGSADLTINITSDVDDGVVAGDTVTYTVNVTNDGPDTAANVVVTNIVPDGLTFAATDGCALDPNGLPCSLGALAAGESATFTIAVTVDDDALGTVDSTVEVTSGTADPDPGDNNATASVLIAGPPEAVDDGPASNSVPGDDFHTGDASPFTLAAPGLLANDNVGSPPGVILLFGGGDLGGSVGDNGAGGTVPLGTGQLQVFPDGSVEFVPPDDFSGPFTFQYRLANEGGFSDATATIYVGPRPVVMGGDLIYLSTAGSGTVDGVIFEDEDVLVYDRSADTWALFIDGSDLGLGTADIDGFAVRDDGSILLSLTAPRTIPGAGPTDDSDIILFTPTSTGETTAGTFSLFVDGSDLNLRAGGEDIDAVSGYGDGDVAISTFGAFNMGGGVAGVDEDLVALGLTGTGAATSGNPSILLDGSDVDFGAEDISGTSIDPATGIIYLANLGVFDIPGLSGDGDDVIAFAGTTGPATAGTFSTFFAGEDARFDNHQIDAVHIAQGDGGPPNTPPRITNTQTEYSPPEYQSFQIDLALEDDEDPASELEFSVGGPDAGAFLIDGVSIVFLPVFDFENPTDDNGDGVYEAEVTVTDTGGLTDTETFSVTVTDVEPDPLIFDAYIGESDADTLEDAVVIESGDSVPLVLAIEEDFSDLVFWVDVVVNGENVPADPAEICGLPLPFEQDAFCVIEVPAADAPGGTELDVTVTLQLIVPPGAQPELEPLVQTTLTDSAWYRTNGSPEIDESTATASVPEGQTSATDIQTSDDVDSEGSGLTYLPLTGPDASKLSIDAATGVITFNAPPDSANPEDHNLNNVYEVEVEVEDSDGFSDSADVFITVTEVTGSISGKVFDDLNGDGIDQDEPPLTDITVTLYLNSGTEATVQTEADGTYTFGGLAPALGYQVGFTLPGGYSFSPQDAGNDDTVDSDVNPQFGLADVPLALGENKSDVDAGMVQPPTITTLGPFDVAENTLGSVDINSSEDPDVSYTLGGDDGFLFDIDPATGIISFMVAPDYENPGDEGENNDYDVRVTATDSGGLTGSADIVINVTNVIEQATVGNFIWDDANSDGLQDEGEPGVEGILVELQDPDTFAVIDSDTTDENGFYGLTADPGTYLVVIATTPPGLYGFTAPDVGNDDTIDSDFNRTFPEALVTLADDEVNDTIDGGLLFQAPNQAPEITNGGGSSVPERQVSAVDVDATDDGPQAELIYSIQVNGVDDGALFTIDPATGVVEFLSAPDYENPTDVGQNNGYTFVARVTDQQGLFDEEVFTIAVTDVEEDPVITNTGPNSVDENATIAVDVDAIDDVDSEVDETLTYSLDPNPADDNALFTIDPLTGVVSFLTPPDYENPTDVGQNNAYTFLAKVTDSEGNFDEQVFTVTVDNLSEPGTIGDRVWDDTNGNGIQDGGEPGRNGVTVNLIDPVEDAIILTETTAGDGNYGFTVDPGQYIVEFIAPAGSVFTTQGAGVDPAIDSDADPTTGRTATITVLDDVTDDTIDAGLVPPPNLPPTLGAGSLEVDEGDTFVDDLIGDDDQDSEGAGLTFSITGGADGSRFEIDEDFGVLSFIDPPDFENPVDDDQFNDYEVEVTVTDTGGLTAVEVFEVTVLDVNEAPTVNSQNFTIEETAADGDPVGTVVASDPENDALTFSLDDETNITIDPSTGELTVAPGANLVAGNISLTVTVTDTESLQDTAAIIVTVTSVNRPPIVGDQGFTVAEDAPAGTVIGTVVATDPDFDTLSYSLDVSSQVAIDPASGELTVVDVSGLTVGADIELTVTVSDQEPLSDTGSIVISIATIPLLLDTPTSGAIDPAGDTDSYTFDGTAGDLLFFDVLTLDGGGCNGSGLRWSLVDPGGSPVVGFTNSSLINCDAFDKDVELAQTGQYTLTFDGNASNTGDYQFEVVTVPDDVPMALTLDTPTSGALLVRGETDSYTFTGTAGDLLFFDVLDLNSGSCNGAGLRWSLFDPGGSPVVGFTNSSLINCDAFDKDVVLGQSGQYTLTFDGSNAAIGSYQFEVVTVPDDVPMALTLDTPTSGALLVRGETDSYTFTGTAGDLLFFDVLDLNSGSCNGAGLRWSLFDPGGSPVVGFTNSSLINCDAFDKDVELAQTGQYTLVIDGSNAATGDYEFEVVTVPVDTPTALTFNTPTSGAIAVRGSTQSFTFTGAIGDELLFDILDLNSGSCSGSGVRWTLAKPSGASVPSFNSVGLINCTNADRTVILDEAGTYALVFDGLNDSTGDYQFTVDPQP